MHTIKLFNLFLPSYSIQTSCWDLSTWNFRVWLEPQNFLLRPPEFFSGKLSRVELHLPKFVNLLSWVFKPAKSLDTMMAHGWWSEHAKQWTKLSNPFAVDFPTKLLLSDLRLLGVGKVDVPHNFPPSTVIPLIEPHFQSCPNCPNLLPGYWAVRKIQNQNANHCLFPDFVSNIFGFVTIKTNPEKGMKNVKPDDVLSSKRWCRLGIYRLF